MKVDLTHYSNEMREIYDEAWEHGNWQSLIRSIWRIVGT